MVSDENLTVSDDLNERDYVEAVTLSYVKEGKMVD
jgi:hypothetical protein